MISIGVHRLALGDTRRDGGMRLKPLGDDERAKFNIPKGQMALKVDHVGA